jgi:subfamily B ATP-binding cassette protein MsbA
MKLYLRLLSYAGPIARLVLPYALFSLLGSVFGILNLTLLQPLLDVLFGTQPLKPLPQPEATFDLEYPIQLFNYHLTRITLESGKLRALQFVCVVIIGSVFLANVFRYAASRFIEKLKGQVVTNLRSAVFDKALHLHLGFFNDTRKGDLMTRLTTDMVEIDLSVTRGGSAIFKELFLLVGYFVALFYKSVELTLFSLVVIPISGVIIGTLSKRLRENATDVQNTMSRMVSLFDETFGGMRVVKGFNAEGFLTRQFDGLNQRYFRLWRNVVYRHELSSPLSEFLGVSVVAGILLYGGSMVLSGESTLTASAFITYIALFSQVTQPAKAITSAISIMQRGRASAERILSLLDEPVRVTDRPGAQTLTGFRDRIEVRDMSFAYATGQPVLRHVNFTLAKGKTIALVGSSGGGKSTIADLIPRFYDPTAGQILIDGTDLRDVTQASLRAQMGVVTQESILFNDTVFNNIAFGLDVTPTQVEEAARIAHAHEFVSRMPEGYQTVIGDRGSRLSGGQRQRLSIARAILKNPPVLILDEATSALDTESERLVQDALAHLMQNRTTLVIAHRLSTIQHADEILVVHQGEIAERGTHDELLNLKNGLYRRLSQWQEQGV